MPFQVINPATGKIVTTYEELSQRQIEERLERAETCFQGWKESSFEERARYLRAAARTLRAKRGAYARTITEEMGKPITAAQAEVEKCALACEFFADHAGGFLAPEDLSPASPINHPSEGSESFVRYDPLGPILAIMPWNFPFWQVFRFCAPALAAGNVGLLKHASNVPGCSLAIEDVLREAGFPHGAFQSLLISSSQVPAILGDRRVRAVTLTGSESAGSKVAEIAGREIKKSVLELGGSDPFIVLEDADLEKAADAGAKARAVNSGQSCIAAKRFIVHHSRLREFESLLRKNMASLKVGAPDDPSTEVGPLAREDLVATLSEQVEKSVELGAELLSGGHRLERPGFFYAPTVLSGAKRGMPIWDEETFGPVAAVAAAKDEEDAIRLANDTPYGLGASLWTRDLEKGKRLAAKIDAGMVFLNGMVKSDPRLPFGGVKRSGYGRELGCHGIREFVNTKTVWIA